MTRIVIATVAAILAFAFAPANADDSVVLLYFTPNPEIAAYLAKIETPERTVPMTLKSRNSPESKVQEVTVIGSISEADIVDLLQAVLSIHNDYWTSDPGKFSWQMSIRGDGNYAIVSVGVSCDMLCGSGESYTYSFKDGSWHFEYSSDRWIS